MYHLMQLMSCFAESSVSTGIYWLAVMDESSRGMAQRLSGTAIGRFTYLLCPLRVQTPWSKRPTSPEKSELKKSIRVRNNLQTR